MWKGASALVRRICVIVAVVDGLLVASAPSEPLASDDPEPEPSDETADAFDPALGEPTTARLPVTLTVTQTTSSTSPARSLETKRWGTSLRRRPTGSGWSTRRARRMRLQRSLRLSMTTGCPTCGDSSTIRRCCWPRRAGIPARGQSVGICRIVMVSVLNGEVAAAREFIQETRDRLAEIGPGAYANEVEPVLAALTRWLRHDQ